jgi:hypothetical protein
MFVNHFRLMGGHEVAPIEIDESARRSAGGIKLPVIPQPDEYGGRAQQLWVERLRTHPSAPHREAAVQQLGENGKYVPLSADSLQALLECAICDDSSEVRKTARDVLIHALEGLDL